MKSIITVAVAACTLLVASLPGHAASKIHGREYSEGPRCFNIQPHHHFDRTLRFRNRCSLDVTGLYCFVDTGNGHGTCENGENHPLLRSDKTAWPEETVLEEFRREFEKSGRRITVKGGKKKNLANLDFKAGLAGIIWSACYVKDIAAGKCRIKPASQLWREKSAPPKQDTPPKQPEELKPKPPAPKQPEQPKPKPPAPKQPEQPKPKPPAIEPNQPMGEQLPEADCVSFLDAEICGNTLAKKALEWIYSAFDIGYLVYTIKAGVTGVILVLVKLLTVFGPLIGLGIYVRKRKKRKRNKRRRR